MVYGLSLTVHDLCYILWTYNVCFWLGWCDLLIGFCVVWVCFCFLFVVVGDCLWVGLGFLVLVFLCCFLLVIVLFWVEFVF